MKKRLMSLQTLFLRNMMFTAFISIGTLFLFWGYSEYKAFVSESESIREAFVRSQKEMLRNEVSDVADYIDYMRGRTEARFRESIKDRVYEAHAVASNIYRQNGSTRPVAEVKKMIKDALRPVRFNEGRGYYFAFTLDGVEELFAVRPEMEGKDMLPVQGAKGEYVVKEMLNIVRGQNEGFYTYTWSKPEETDASFRKMAFVKLFEPLGWVIGTGEYIDDVRSRIQDEVLDRIAQQRFGEEGYFFGSAYGGKPLFTNGRVTRGAKSVWELTDPNGVKIIQEQNRAANNSNGGFVNYSWQKLNSPKPSPKASFVMGIPEWEWVIGAGLYLDTIEDALASKENALYREFLGKALFSIIVLGMLLILIYLWGLHLSRKIRNSIGAFSDFFSKAASDAVFIDPETLRFSEFGDIAVQANRMLKASMEGTAALKESEKKFRTLFENMAEGVFYQRPGGALTDVNQSALDMLGLTRDQFLGATSMDPRWRMVNEDGANMPGEQHPSMKALSTGKAVRNVIAGVFNPQKKQYVWITINAIPLFNDGEDKPCRVFVTIHDISGLKQLEDELKRSEARYRTLFNNNPVQTIIVNSEARITMYNFAEEKSEGKLPVIGEVMYRDYAPRHDRDMLFELKACISSGTPKEFSELKYKERVLHIRISPFSDGAIITAIDITEIKALHEQLQQARKMEAIGTLAGGVAHDFNNILSIIIGNMELALDKVPENNPARRNLKEIRIASLRARDVVGQLLSYSRKTGRERKPVRIDGVLKESVNLLRASIPSTIEIRTEVPERIGVIRADSTQIQQVIINLCTNAAQAMEGDGGLISISLKEVRLDLKMSTGYHEISEGRYVRLIVADTGPGIEHAILEKVFDPYFTTKEVGKGTGMGLAVVQGIVNSHEGAIWISSDPRKGTSVHLLFPVIEAVPAPVPAVLDDAPGGNESILFVDDEEAVGTLWKLAFEHLGYRVEAISNPRDALELFRADPGRFNLVITDMTMPQMTGEELVKEILEIEATQPIILCTGFSEKISCENAAEIGIRKYLDKPLERGVFARAVREVLDEAS